MIPVKDDVNVFNSVDSYVASVKTMETECIVVINGGDKKFIDKFGRYKLQTDVKIFELSTPNIACARNFGISKSSGVYMVFMDSDNTIPVDYFIKLEQKIDDIDILMGDLLFEIDENDEFTLLNRWFHNRTNSRTFKKYFFTPNLVVKTALFYKYGGFDPMLSGSEDGDWSSRMRRYDGFTYEFVENLVMNNIPERINRRKKSWEKYGYGFMYRQLRNLRYKEISKIQFIMIVIGLILEPFENGLTLKQRMFCLSFLYHFIKGMCRGFLKFASLSRDDYIRRESLMLKLPVTIV